MVVLVAVRTCDVAATGRDHVRQDRMVGIDQRFGDHAGFAKAAMETQHLAANARAERYIRHHSRPAATDETPAATSNVNYSGRA